jgi:hypothetical protein
LIIKGEPGIKAKGRRASGRLRDPVFLESRVFCGDDFEAKSGLRSTKNAYSWKIDL